MASDVASWEWLERWSNVVKEAMAAWRRGRQLQRDRGEIFVFLVFVWVFLSVFKILIILLN